MDRQRRDEKELGEALKERGHAGRKAVLSPETAIFVGVKLLTASKKPTRDEVAKMICGLNCKDICYTCIGKANLIVRAYGSRVPDDPVAP